MATTSFSKVSVRWLACAVVSLLSFGAHTFPVAPGYSVSEISYGGGPMLWIDSDTILFVGAPVDRASELGRSNASKEIALYRWDTGTGNVSEMMKAGDYARLCYDRGYLYLAFDRDMNRVVREGPIGHEKESIFKRGAESPRSKGAFNPYDCRFRPVPPPTQPDHAVITILRDDHGFIEAQRPAERLPQRKYFLVRPSGQRVTLDNFRGGAGGPRLSLFREAYVYQYGGSDLSANAEKHIWVIGVDGTATDYALPKGPWLGGAVRAMPVRDGLLLISPSTLTNAEGVYLVRGSEVERIVKGYVNDFSVSPGGCKVAIYIRPTDSKNSRHAVLNTCKEGK